MEIVIVQEKIENKLGWSNLPLRNLLRKPLIRVFLLIILCSLSYILGTSNYNHSTSTTSTPILQDPHCFQLNLTTLEHSSPPPSLDLDFELHHSPSLPPETSHDNPQYFKVCTKNFTNYCPCQDPSREKQFDGEKLFHKSGNCPNANETLRCLVPSPARYRRPLPWPKSRDSVWFNNVPFPKLTIYKKSQNWVRLEGKRLVFPGGGTSFPMGVKGYVDELRRVVPLKSGNIRTVLDVG
ncbi:hypothetical protein L1049_016316 [Liquidambar formosana]|uniref:Methyltransferase n=1 Tax=Liquidambar formosana TaxID=63359 RepID=A0AAP0X0G6_LIQFO